MIPRFTGADYAAWIKDIRGRFAQSDLLALNTNFLLAGKITAEEHATAQRLILQAK